MKIQLLRTIESSPSGALVEFSTAFGNGLSYFQSFEPQENHFYDVELDIDDEFKWNENLKISKETAPSISFNSDNLQITAELIAFEEGGCGAINIDDSITLISLDKVESTLPVFIELTATRTSLHPNRI
jgi:hypothetical protein